MSNQEIGQTRSEHDCVIASKLHETCNKVQFLGVTATLCAFIAFIWNAKDINNNPVKILLYSIPIILAYLSIANPIFLPEKVKENPKALLWTCWGIFALDTVYLGVLVGITGGTGSSLFTPLFLLIPSAASCFCQPQKKPFWFLISIVVITYMVVWFLEFKGYIVPFVIENGKLSLCLKGGFTVGCIATVAYCYASTYSIRRKKCKEIAGEDACDNLYL